MWNYKRSSGSYRSGLELKVREYLDAFSCIYRYEQDKIDYTIPESQHVYIPDFVLYKKDRTKMYIETKGQWDAEDRKKFFFIKKSNPNLDLRFIFNNPNSKIRKGSKTTYADVCEGKLRGHKDFVVPYAKIGKKGELPKEWLDEVYLNVLGTNPYE